MSQTSDLENASENIENSIEHLKRVALEAKELWFREDLKRTQVVRSVLYGFVKAMSIIEKTDLQWNRDYKKEIHDALTVLPSDMKDFLIIYAIDTRSIDPQGLRALSSSSQEGMLEVLMHGRAEGDQSLLRYRHDHDAFTQREVNPILTCVENGELDFIPLFVKKGFDVNKKSNQSTDSILVCCFTYMSNWPEWAKMKELQTGLEKRAFKEGIKQKAAQTFELLLQHGASIEADRENNIASALSLAVDYRADWAVEILLHHGALKGRETDAGLFSSVLYRAFHCSITNSGSEGGEHEMVKILRLLLAAGLDLQEESMMGAKQVALTEFEEKYQWADYPVLAECFSMMTAWVEKKEFEKMMASKVGIELQQDEDPGHSTVPLVARRL